MANCFVCGKELVPVFSKTEVQFEDALGITFDGGYGMYFDPIWVEGVRVSLCKDCAEIARTALPWLDHFFSAISGDADGEIQPYYEVKQNSF